MPQRQGAVATPVHAEYLDVGLAAAEVVLVGEGLAQCAVARLLVDCGYLQGFFPVVIADREQVEIPHQPW